MAEYFMQTDKIDYQDDLIAGGDFRVENVSVKGEFGRGMILAESGGIYAPVTIASADNLVVAAEDSTSSGTAIGAAYVAGNFHLEKLSTGSSVVSAADMRENLRKDNIFITSMQEA